MKKPVLKGLMFCGTHARTKSPRLWTVVNEAVPKIIQIQKVWRGYRVRSVLKLAGPGVLNRKICHNDEELVTLDDRYSVSPLDYFAFEENKKVYWFDITSLLEITRSNLYPENPYTRERLDISTRKRLRELCNRRYIRPPEVIYKDFSIPRMAEATDAYWMTICQILHEHGFEDMRPEFYLTLNRTQIFVLNQLIAKDLQAWAAERINKPYCKRKQFARWFYENIGEYMAGASSRLMLYFTGQSSLFVLKEYPDPYAMCFILVSALCRL